jgi:hypothetical protein
MHRDTKNVIEQALILQEYQRKQIISVLIASMLTDMSNSEAKQIYDNIINKLK